MPSDRYAATPEKMRPFVQALARETQGRLREVLGDPVTPESLLAATDAAHGEFERTWSHIQRLHVVQHACRPGCDFCCHLTVEVSAPEALRIAEHLRETLPAAEWEHLWETVRRTADRVRGLTPAARVRAAIPCALLQDGGCAAYDVRPLGCRSWNSRDAAACARVLRDGGGDLRPVQDQRPLGINVGVREGFLATLTAAGLPEDADRPCELNTALEIALDTPQALERWLGGEDVFAPSRQ